MSYHSCSIKVGSSKGSDSLAARAITAARHALGPHFNTETNISSVGVVSIFVRCGGSDVNFNSVCCWLRGYLAAADFETRVDPESIDLFEALGPSGFPVFSGDIVALMDWLSGLSGPALDGVHIRNSEGLALTESDVRVFAENAGVPLVFCPFTARTNHGWSDPATLLSGGVR